MVKKNIKTGEMGSETKETKDGKARALAVLKSTEQSQHWESLGWFLTPRPKFPNLNLQ